MTQMSEGQFADKFAAWLWGDGYIIGTSPPPPIPADVWGSITLSEKILIGMSFGCVVEKSDVEPA